MDQIKITVRQYQRAIVKALNFRQIEVLKVLYSFPNSTATAKELAKAINPHSPAPIVANRQVGLIGRSIAEYSGVTLPSYRDSNEDKPAYIAVVGWYETSGWEMQKNLQNALLDLELVRATDRGSFQLEQLPTEEMFNNEQALREGKVVIVHVDKYERNRKARAKCIEHFGISCQACGFDFHMAYGKMAEGYIQVHHVRPLSDVRKEYKVDPVKYLIPLCANCHCTVHLSNPAMTIAALKRLIKKAERSQAN